MSMMHRKRREATSRSNGNGNGNGNGNDNEEAAAAHNEQEDTYPTTSSSPPFSNRTKGATASFRRRRLMLATATAGAAACFLLSAAAAWYFLSTLAFLRIVTLTPVAVCLYQGLFGDSGSNGGSDSGSDDDDDDDDDDGSSRLLPLALVATVVTAQFPTFMGAAVAALAVLFFSLVTLPLHPPPADANANANVTTNITTAGTNGTHDSANNHHDHDHHDHPKASPSKVVLAVIVLVTVLLTENFMIWVVSATFEPGWNVSTAPPPLQDNGRHMIQYLLRNLTKQQVVSLRRLWNVQWSLVACLGVSLYIVQVQHQRQQHNHKHQKRRQKPCRQLYSIGTRAVITLATARCIRTVSFLLTVLPSQNKACYAQHLNFPNPPPAGLYDWLAVGLQPAAHGGCNDLIISGHATVTATMACVASSVAMSSMSSSTRSGGGRTNYTFATALWIMVVLDYCIEIYEGFHYAVDMWLGMVLVVLLWNALAPLEERDYYQDSNDNDDNNDKDKDKSGPTVTRASTGSSNKPSVVFIGTMKDVGLYSLPALAAYLQLTFMPQSTANPLIVVYVLFASLVYSLSTNKSKSVAAAQAYQHYAQHVLLCLLFLALGVYL